MVKPVIAIALRPPLKAAGCCSFVSECPLPSRDRDIGGSTRDALAGKSSREEDQCTFHKKHSGR
jgi:hypothetical protein